MPPRPTGEKAAMAKLVGKLMTDANFRETFEVAPAASAKRLGLVLDSATITKLTKLNGELLAGKLRGVGGGGDQLHCEVASSVGYA